MKSAMVFLLLSTVAVLVGSVKPKLRLGNSSLSPNHSASQQEGTISSFVDHSATVRGLVESNILLTNASPAPDSISSYRKGKIQIVPIPSGPGQTPYAITYTKVGPFVAVLPTNYGKNLLNEKMRKQLVDAHNYVRKLEAPEATYMNKLTWDFHLEAYALQWTQYLCTAAEQKFFEHSPDSSAGTPGWPFRVVTGENLYTTTGERDASWDPSDVVYKWYDEKLYYDWNTGKAAPSHSGKPVGHYKQLVRQEATTVGCAVFSGCKQSPDWRTFVSCHYDHGNFGKDPYVRRPDNRKGAVCDECPQNFKCCESGLCDGQFLVASYSLTPSTPATHSSNDWYYCKDHMRNEKQCDGTAAFKHLADAGSKEYALEYQSCLCGGGITVEDGIATVSTGLYWYRNACRKVSRDSGTGFLQMEAGDPTSTGQKAGLLAAQDAEVEAIFLDMEPYNASGFIETGAVAQSLVETASAVFVSPPPHSQVRLDLSRHGFQALSDGSEQAFVLEHKIEKVAANEHPSPPKFSSQETSKELKKIEAIIADHGSEVSRATKSGSGVEARAGDPQEGVVKVVSDDEQPVLEKKREIIVTGDEIEELA